MDFSLLRSSIHGIFQATVLEWVAISFSRGSSQPRDQTKDDVICTSKVIDISPGNLDSPCKSSSPAFHMMYSAYKLNEQGDNIHPWRTPFPIWKHSIVSCLVLTVTSWPAYRFLRRQVKCSGIPISSRIFPFVVIHTQFLASSVKQK